MSRIGRKPIAIPNGVEVKVNGAEVTVKGPKGTLTRTLSPEISIKVEENQVIVERPSDHRKHRALHGTVRSLVANMVEGVTNGYSKTLELVGVGYRAQKKGTKWFSTWDTPIRWKWTRWMESSWMCLPRPKSW